MQRNCNRSQVAVFCDFVTGRLRNAWIDCPLGPQRFDYHDGFADDCDGGVFDSIATGLEMSILG
jgi:hypothetical protein